MKTYSDFIESTNIMSKVTPSDSKFLIVLNASSKMRLAENPARFINSPASFILSMLKSTDVI